VGIGVGHHETLMLTLTLAMRSCFLTSPTSDWLGTRSDSGASRHLYLSAKHSLSQKM